MNVLDRETATTAEGPVTAKVAQGDVLVRNFWYIAAWSAEIKHELMQRWILDQPIAMYRSEAGEVIAMADRCPHRRYPLSKGCLVGDNVQCSYHGFTFAPTGTCVSVPGQTSIPSAARVKTYPVVEKNGVVWLWPGDPSRASVADVPNAPWITDWTTITGYAHLNARAILLVDNLLDLSHETYLHPSSIGTSDVAETPISVEQKDGVLHVGRRMSGAECPPFYKNSTGITGTIDRWQEIDFYPPGYYLLNIRVAPTGSTDEAYHMKVIYGITPETGRSVHDFWAVCRDFARVDDALSEALRAQQTFVVQEDVDAVNDLERMVTSDNTNLPEISIGIDRGGLVARRLIADLGKVEALS